MKMGTIPTLRNRTLFVTLLGLLTIGMVNMMIQQFQFWTCFSPTNNNNGYNSKNYYGNEPSSSYRHHVVVPMSEALNGIALRCRRQIRYFPKPKLLVSVMAKGGTTSTLTWLYGSLTGNSIFNVTECKGIIHNMDSKCWQDDNVGHFLSRLSLQEQEDILTSKDVLRVAIVRDPFDRLLSGYKDKISCENKKHLNEKIKLSTHLRTFAKLNQTNSSLQPNTKGWEWFFTRNTTGFWNNQTRIFKPKTPCMNISDFAITLDSIRKNHPIEEIRTPNIDAHFAPQDLCDDLIQYDLVLNTDDLSYTSAMKPIMDRLGDTDLIRTGIKKTHGTPKGNLIIPEQAVISIHRYARLTPNFYFNRSNLAA